MPFKLPKVSGNQLFTPFTLLFIFAAVILISNLEFKDNYNTYSYILAIANFCLFLKAFIISFSGIEENLKAKRWVYAAINILSGAGQFWLSWRALDILTRNSYPRDTLGFMAIANILFYLQLFLSKVPGKTTTMILSFFVYILLFALLFLNLFVGQNIIYLGFLQLTSYLILGVEILNLFGIIKFFVKK